MSKIIKIIYLTMIIVLILGSLSGCGSNGGSEVPDTQDESGLKIVTTIFPEYDWAVNIIGDDPGDAEVTLLINSGVDLHSYQPAADDILKISTADVLVYLGGESDKWVEDALRTSSNEEMIVVSLLDELGSSVKEEEVVEGMQGEDDEGDEEEPEYDEHVWLSLKNAAFFVNCLQEAISKADPENAETYKANADAYIEKIRALDEEYEAAVSAAPTKTLLFGDRFPFRYLTDDYGLEYYAAFVGCSAETEASFETITFLSTKIDELGLHSVMTIEGTDHRIAETIIQNTKTKDQKILTLDSMQSVTADQAANGVSYLSIMESDLSVLKEALN